MYSKQFSRKQGGFTLVEIALVLVIVGLLLGGVLKGQEMIENARIKAVVSDMNGVTAAYNSYFDRYRAIPGDETAAVMTARGWTGTAGATGAGASNGALSVTPAQIFTNGGEQSGMWRALRASGMVGGDPTAPSTVAGLPRSGTGGLMGVGLGVYGMGGPAICVSALSTRQVAGVDVLIDGPLPATNIGNNVGSARAATGTATPLVPLAPAPGALVYDETATTTLWTLCRKM